MSARVAPVDARDASPPAALVVLEIDRDVAADLLVVLDAIAQNDPEEWFWPTVVAGQQALRDSLRSIDHVDACARLGEAQS